MVTSGQAALHVVPSENINVFTDPAYVYFEHAVNTRSSLARLGHHAQEFTDLASATTVGTNVIVIPALEANDLAQGLSPATREALQGFVARGGLVIVLGSANDYSRASRLINTVLGVSTLGSFAATTATRTA